MFENSQIRQVNSPNMFRKKSLSDEIFLHFLFQNSESDRVFIYLHDSNSIFRAGGINSEWVSGRTVVSCMTSKLLIRRRSGVHFFPDVNALGASGHFDAV